MAEGSVWVSPWMLPTKVMVAPNSPIDRAKLRIAPAITPGSTSGRVTSPKHPERRGAERPGRLLEPPVDGLDRQAHGADHQREPHDGAGQRRPGPAEREGDAEFGIEPAADRPAPAEGQQQQIAGHDGRQDQREMNDRVEQPLSGEGAPAPARARSEVPERGSRASLSRRPAGSAAAPPRRRVRAIRPCRS